MEFLKLNNKRLTSPKKKFTILQLCANNNVEIPRFCYHERLSIAGNCRMCLVEIDKALKPVASCAMPIGVNMHILTNTSLVKKAREGVLEFLLANHPLDCPICDQGGECDLQDQVLIFGSDRGRFYEYKRSIEDKDCGPLVKTLMTRCIHCTRCVRFSTEIAGVGLLGTTGRGLKTEIGTYLERLFSSELSGNVIDLCPVGALTSKPYAYIARSWELKTIETIDILDSLGSNIIVDFRGDEVIRILPRINEDLNEEWINDRTRFSYDGLKIQRLEKPFYKIGSSLVSGSWELSFNKIQFFIQKNKPKLNVILGNLVDIETSIMLKDLSNSYGNFTFFFNNKIINNDLRENYLININLKDLKRVDLIILLNINLREELPIINARLRRIILKKNLILVTFGCNHNLTYRSKNLSNNTKGIIHFLEGKHWFCNLFVKSKKPIILVGEAIKNRQDVRSILNSLKILNSFVKKKKRLEYC